MRTLIVIDLTVKRRQGLHLITEDVINGITPETAKEIIELKYETKKQKVKLKRKW